MKKTLFMETTKINAARTVGEIHATLVRAGARQVASQYDDDGVIVGLTWTMRVNGSDVAFKMPARMEPVYYLLAGRIAGIIDDRREQELRQKAKRVAWRQLLRWTEAQLAMIDTGMVSGQEVFMPYAVSRNGQTLFEVFQDRGQKLLGGNVKAGKASAQAKRKRGRAG